MCAVAHGPAQGAHRHLVLGHVCWDELADGRVLLGGTAYYAAVQAQRLGCAVTVQTACTEATLAAVHALLGPEVVVRSAGSDVDTRYAFEGAAEDGPTRLVSLATALTSIDAIGQADSAHIAPIAGEVSPGLIRSVRDRVGFVGVTPQGLMRQFSHSGLLSLGAQEVTYLPLADAVVVNEPEYLMLLRSQPEAIADLRAQLFVTRGARGASLIQAGREVARCVPPRTARDPSSTSIGAGDVFASTAFVGLARGDRPAAVLEEAVSAASAFVSRPRHITVTP